MTNKKYLFSFIAILFVSLVTMGISSPIVSADTINTISPSSVVAGSGASTITINGSGFATNSVVRFNGVNVPTVYNSSSQLVATVPAASLTSAGTFSVTVYNPASGGSLSNAQTFTVATGSNPTPAVTGLSSTSVNAGSGALTLTINGSNFAGGSVVRFNGVDLPTSYVSGSQLSATIPASSLTTAGTFNVTVFSPTPGGGSSNIQTFTVNTTSNNPVPTTTSISPVSMMMGSSGSTLTVNGINFLPSSVVHFNGISRATTYVSGTQLTATIPAADFATVGNYNVTVVNPIPGGGTSNAQVFSVNTSSSPIISTITPSVKIVGSGAFTLTVNGWNFTSASNVRINGTARTTTYISPNQLTVLMLASDVANIGTWPITVSNPTGNSNAVSFMVSAVPGLPDTGISPNNSVTDLSRGLALFAGVSLLAILGVQAKKMFFSQS